MLHQKEDRNACVVRGWLPSTFDLIGRAGACQALSLGVFNAVASADVAGENSRAGGSDVYYFFALCSA
jgi:hypothetical protein